MIILQYKNEKGKTMNENMESNINIAEPIIQKKEENVLSAS